MRKPKSAQRDVINRFAVELMPFVNRRVRRRLKGWPADLRDDVAAGVMLALIERILPASLPRYRPERAKLGDYVSTSIDNEITDQLRRLERERGLLLLEEELQEEVDPIKQNRPADPLDQIIVGEIYRDLPNLSAACLSPGLLNVVEARRRHGPGREGAEAAAKELGITIDSFWARESTAMARIRELLESQLSEQDFKRKAA